MPSRDAVRGRLATCCSEAHSEGGGRAPCAETRTSSASPWSFAKSRSSRSAGTGVQAALLVSRAASADCCAACRALLALRTAAVCDSSCRWLRDESSEESASSPMLVLTTRVGGRGRLTRRRPPPPYFATAAGRDTLPAQRAAGLGTRSCSAMRARVSMHRSAQLLHQRRCAWACARESQLARGGSYWRLLETAWAGSGLAYCAQITRCKAAFLSDTGSLVRRGSQCTGLLEVALFVEQMTAALTVRPGRAAPRSSLGLQAAAASSTPGWARLQTGRSLQVNRGEKGRCE